VPGLTLAHVTTVDLSLWFLLGGQLRAFREQGFHVVGISAPGPWVGSLARAGVTHVAVAGLRRAWAPAADARALGQLVRVFRRLRPAIVHTHTPKAGVLGRIAARLAGVPVVVNTVHGFYVGRGGARRRALLWAEQLAARCSDFELCQSREDLSTLRTMGILRPERSAYLGNGVDLATFDPTRVDRVRARARLGIPPDAVVVGTVGRLVWEKGYREFFAMAETLVRRTPAPVVLAVGPAEAEKDDAVPAAVVEDLRRLGVVRFLGMRTDMPDLYAAMDVFVLASHREGFPRSAVEAAAMGLPLVLTDIRGCREVVRHGENGLLVPPGDVGALVAGVEQLVADPALRAQFGQASRHRAVAEFDERRVVATTLAVYRQLLREKMGVGSGAHQARRAG
jgi:glycosyltransferase involved in cell wall biosynthesis